MSRIARQPEAPHPRGIVAIVELVIFAFAIAVIAVSGYWVLRRHHHTAAHTTSATNPSAKTTAQPASQLLPLGDGKVTTAGPKQGYVYSCTASFRGGGAQHDGGWIEGNQWDPSKKIHVQGDVSWPSATVNISLSGSSRVISSNDLPTNHTTGTFPIASSDPAYQFDTNPNAIVAQKVLLNVPANPTAAASSECTTLGPIGVMINGVYLFNALDAAGRDAQAHEVQDHCSGHPQQGGQYHYHGLSPCFSNVSATHVIGYALDGYAITGPKKADGSSYTTNQLDICHGTTSAITLDGRTQNVYHYVMTNDYPYSISCFHGMAIAVGQGQGGGVNGRQDGAARH